MQSTPNYASLYVLLVAATSGFLTQAVLSADPSDRVAVAAQLRHLATGCLCGRGARDIEGLMSCRRDVADMGRKRRRGRCGQTGRTISPPPSGCVRLKRHQCFEPVADWPRIRCPKSKATKLS
ncbi:hypothetical protein GE09DRAFT_1085607, partial [Coniochaeta sp. 2T2.1]